jgi:hypothetical protein
LSIKHEAVEKPPAIYLKQKTPKTRVSMLHNLNLNGNDNPDV